MTKAVTETVTETETGAEAVREAEIVTVELQVAGWVQQELGSQQEQQG